MLVNIGSYTLEVVILDCCIHDCWIPFRGIPPTLPIRRWSLKEIYVFTPQICLSCANSANICGIKENECRTQVSIKRKFALGLTPLHLTPLGLTPLGLTPGSLTPWASPPGPHPHGPHPPWASPPLGLTPLGLTPQASPPALHPPARHPMETRVRHSFSVNSQIFGEIAQFKQICGMKT